jgi:hypothetical protein
MNEIMKALNCVIGSSCLVSTPDTFYIGPKGIGEVSEATIEYINEQMALVREELDIMNNKIGELAKGS